MSDRCVAITGLVIGVLGITITLITFWITGARKRDEPTVPGASKVEVRWQEPQGWRCHDGLELSVEPGDEYTFVLSGSNNAALSISREATISPDKAHNVLIVEVANSGASAFRSDDGRMLKVSIGDEATVLRCVSAKDISRSDPNFVTERQGYFFYIIPEEFWSQPQSLMLTFWNADIQKLRLKAGSTTEEAIELAERGERILVPARFDQRFFQLVATSAVISTIVQVAGLVVALAGFCAAIYFGQRMLRRSGQ